MRLTDPVVMAKPVDDPFVIAGSGGVALGQARTNHHGRKAILLVRGDSSTTEMQQLAETMGITIVETVGQSGGEDPRTYFGKGRLQDIVEELHSTMDGHPWHEVDLVLVHTNASPRQLVGMSGLLGYEIWDRVRLLLALFTAHASSVEARTQVRIAQLQSDRTILREMVQQQTTGERAGYGGGGATALQNVLGNLNRELTNLRRRLQKQSNAQQEHRRQRARSGAMSVGFVGYTNAGKSSLFQRLSGKEVLVEDKLFSTLETTVGRMEKSPRILLVDTIGFIDNIPNATLSAFKATIAEAIDADLTMVLVDASDSIPEIRRKLATTRREVLERRTPDDLSTPAYQIAPQLVLTKIDKIDAYQLHAVRQSVEEFGFERPLCISSHTNQGIAELHVFILERLFGSACQITVFPPTAGQSDASAKIASEVYESGMVERDLRTHPDHIELIVWMKSDLQAQLQSRWRGRIEIK